jgi:predicted amidohydrolase
MRTLAVAAIQTQPVPGDREATYAQFERQVRSVRRLFPHVQLVVVPELLLAAEGPLLGAETTDMSALAESLPGPLTDRLGDLAVGTGLWLVPGSVYELGEDDRVYNTAIVISPEGELVGRYRKIFPWQPYETSCPGTEPVVVDLPGIGRIGLAICYDGSFPEVIRQLAWYGAEVVLQPTLTPTRDRDMEVVCSRANAWTNQVYVVNVNAADPVAVGQSLIVDPEGTVRQQAGSGEEILVDVLDLDAVARVREFGSHGLNRPWRQIAEHGRNVRLPMYADGVMQPPPWHSSGPEPRDG